jgi:hypothetical protein
VEFEDGSEVQQVEEGLYTIKGKSGETLTKTIRFRFKNCNQTEAVTERTFTVTIDQLQKVWIYGENPEVEPPFQPAAWDAAAMRFSSTEGKYLPTLADEIYFSHKTLILDVVEASDDCTARVMNGWWSNTYEDNIPLSSGMKWEVKITDEMARECAKGGDGKDLDLMIISGSCTINAVYYEE